MSAMFEKKVLRDEDTEQLIAISNELINKAKWPRLSISEQRLVLYMLALLKPQDADFKTYRISIKELGNIVGSKHKNLYAQFDEATDGLMSKIIRWIEKPYSKDRRLKKVTWCSSAVIAEGEGFVELCFDPLLKPFLLTLKGNFTQYELRAVIRLQSHYSLRIYQFLKFNQGIARRDGRISARVTVDWLKEYLDISADQYQHYGHFKSKVLNPSRRDIAKKTDLLFDFIEEKEGRKIKFLRFFWHKNPDYDQQELPFDPPVEHQGLQPNERQPSPDQHQESDEICATLQDLGFADWRKIRDSLSVADWRLALADLEYNIHSKSKRNTAIANPGGWLRSRLPAPGEAYTPSKPYQKHRDGIRQKQTQAKRQAEAERRRQQEETEREESERRLEERIDAKLKKISKRDKEALQAQAEKKAQDLLPEPARHRGQALTAAREKLKTLSKTQEAKVRRKATAEIKKHLQETASTLQLTSAAGKTVLSNRMLEIIAREFPLEHPAQATYRKQLESLTNQTLRRLVQEKYQLTGDPA